jgi:hypothetical protein
VRKRVAHGVQLGREACCMLQHKRAVACANFTDPPTHAPKHPPAHPPLCTHPLTGCLLQRFQAACFGGGHQSSEASALVGKCLLICVSTAEWLGERLGQLEPPVMETATATNLKVGLFLGGGGGLGGP